jgi:predicted ATPase
LADVPVPELIDSKKAKETANHNLPAQLTTFIGRRKELQVIKELIKEQRLVTLTGAGGSGKTRLACEVVATLVGDFEDGVWFVDLSPLTKDEQVAGEILEVLKISETPSQSIAETLIEKIGDQNLLIVLDNCEHLLKGSGEICIQLLQSLAGLRILATSREALNITGEKIWRIPSLTLLDPKTVINLESVKSSEAVMLFTDRARLKYPEFELETGNVNDVVSICSKLDGIPLAVELVASRIAHLSPKKILERFEDKFDLLSSSDPGISFRQQTLHATIEWSYHLLSESEKYLFERISVFSGGFELEAAEEVCSDDHLSKEKVLEALSRLVDRSMVYTLKSNDQTLRYNRLETLRQFGQQMLTSRNEEKLIRSRHLDYNIKVAREAYEEQYEAQQKWAAWYDAEQDNIFSALDWAEMNSMEQFAELAGLASSVWRLRAGSMVSKNYLEKALTKSKRNQIDHARIARGIGTQTWMSSDIKKGLCYFSESLEIWRKLEIPGEISPTLAEMSELLLHSGDYETALKYSQEGLDIARETGNQGLINHCQIYVCTILVHSKQYDKGRPLVEEVLIEAEKLNQLHVIEGAYHLLGDCTLGMGDFAEGEKRYARGIEVSYGQGNIMYAATDIQGVGFAVAGQGRWAKAIRLDAAAREKYTELGFSIDGMLAFWDEWIETYIGGAEKEVGEELAQQYRDEGKAMSFEEAVAYALDFTKD